MWTLVGVMTLQGYLNADEYGSAASFFGGMGLTMSIWKETMGSTMTFWSTPTYNPLPRVIVTAALHETARHPGLKMIPALQKTIKDHQATWERFRVRSMDWMLVHADLVGGLLSDPDARLLWTPYQMKKGQAEAALLEAKKRLCSVFVTAACKAAALSVQRLIEEIRWLTKVNEQWDRVLSLSHLASASHLETALTHGNSSCIFSPFSDALSRLHNVTDPDDERVAALRQLASNISWSLTESGGNSWYRRLLESLLVTEIWEGCLDHIRQRERRVRDLMIVAGVQDLMNTNERILNASLLTVASATDKKKVQDWFGEMSAYAWWLPEDVPSFVRRCAGQEAGDCTRIGPTEITALSAQIGERSKIVEDWTRRIFIGMWNAMPAVCLLFVVELIILCMPKRGFPVEHMSDRHDRFPLRKRDPVVTIDHRLQDYIDHRLKEHRLTNPRPRLLIRNL
jgi:hypothetical protein